MFEHYRQPLLPRQKFLLRMARSVLVSLIILLATILGGTLSFHLIEGYSPIDAFLNSVMIMTGVGTVGTITTDAGKILTGIYSIISTLIFFTTLAIIFTPVLHRVLHRLHLDVDNKDL
jgi:hypothetical protein